MFSKFKNGDKAIVCGCGEEFGRFYNYKLGTVKERDPYYKDYLVKFEDGSQDWFPLDCLHEPQDQEESEEENEYES